MIYCRLTLFCLSMQVVTEPHNGTHGLVQLALVHIRFPLRQTSKGLHDLPKVIVINVILRIDSKIL